MVYSRLNITVHDFKHSGLQWQHHGAGPMLHDRMLKINVGEDPMMVVNFKFDLAYLAVFLA